MGLRFEHSFVVRSDPDRVWAFLIDPYRVAPALPGASITEKTGDGTYSGGITVKVGPVSARYRGTVRFEALDPVARTAAIVATGQDTSGRGGADMRMQSRLTETAPGETEVSMVSEVSVTGIMAQFGRGLIQDVSNQMLERFTGAMRAELEKPRAAATASASAGAGAGAGAGAMATSGTAVGGEVSAMLGAGPMAEAKAVPTAVAGAIASATVTANGSSRESAHPGASAGVSASASPGVSASASPGGGFGGPASTNATAGAPVASPPIEVFSFGGRILLRAAGRAARRPLFWVVVAAVVGCLYWLFH